MNRFLAPPSGAAAALAALDIATMQRGIDRLKGRLDDATHEFVMTQGEVPTYWVALLTVYAGHVADMLVHMRDTPDVEGAFSDILGVLLDKKKRERTHG